MPVGFLSSDQREHYGRFIEELSPDDLARYFHLDEFDLGPISQKRGQHNRLGFAVQLGTLRYLGTFQDDPLDIPTSVLQALTRQLYIDSTEGVQAYLRSNGIGFLGWIRTTFVTTRWHRPTRPLLPLKAARRRRRLSSIASCSAGKSKSPLKKRAPIWASRPSASGRTKPLPAPRLACWRCTPS